MKSAEIDEIKLSGYLSNKEIPSRLYLPRGSASWKLGFLPQGVKMKLIRYSSTAAIILSVLFACGGSKAQRNSAPPDDPNSSSGNGETPTVDTVSDRAYQFVFTRCYNYPDEFDFLKVQIFAKGQYLEDLNYQPAADPRTTPCVQGLVVELPPLSQLDSKTTYEVKVFLAKGGQPVTTLQRALKIVAPGESGSNEGSNPTPDKPQDLWPGEDKQPMQDRCQVRGRAAKCQAFLNEYVQDKAQNKPMRIFLENVTTSRRLGTVVLTPSSADDLLSGTYSIRSGALDPNPPQWATHYGFSSGKYRFKYGRFSLVSADGQHGAYFTITEYNGSFGLLGKVTKGNHSLQMLAF